MKIESLVEGGQMNRLTIFNNEEFGTIRAIERDGEPWFVGKDVAEALGFSNTRDAIKRHVDDDDKGVTKHDTLGGKQDLAVINESGVYALIFGSKLPRAKEFKHWVTSEVLPSIRKHGVYMTDSKAYDLLHNEDSLADLLLQAGEQLKQKNIIIEEMRPKAIFADAVSASNQTILVGELAKILRQNGVVGMGQNRLFEILRNRGYLIKGNRSDKNMPTQRSLEMGLFEIKETAVTHSDGHVTVNKTPKVTGKGQQYFINLFKTK